MKIISQEKLFNVIGDDFTSIELSWQKLFRIIGKVIQAYTKV